MLQDFKQSLITLILLPLPSSSCVTLPTMWTWVSYRAQRRAGLRPVECWGGKLEGFCTFIRTSPLLFLSRQLAQHTTVIHREFPGGPLTERCGRPGLRTQQGGFPVFCWKWLVPIGGRIFSILNMSSHMHLMFIILSWTWNADHPVVMRQTQTESVELLFFFCAEFFLSAKFRMWPPSLTVNFPEMTKVHPSLLLLTLQHAVVDLYYVKPSASQIFVEPTATILFFSPENQF